MLQSIEELKGKRDTCRCYEQSPDMDPKSQFECWWDSWILPQLNFLEGELISAKPLKKSEKIQRAKIRAALLHTLTEYDRQQSTKEGYNLYALGIYCKSLEAVMKDIASGAEPRKAIVAAFTGRLQDRLLKSIGEPIAGPGEQSTSIFYTPASRRLR